MRGADLRELIHIQLLGFGDVGDVHPIRDAVGGIGAGDDVLLAGLLRPPAKRRHPVLDRARGELLAQSNVITAQTRTLVMANLGAVLSVAVLAFGAARLT